MDKLKELMTRANASENDLERKSLFYIIANNSDLYEKVEYIYNFKERCIEPDCLESEEVDFSSSSKALVKLAYSLFNGYPADVFETFCYLDNKNSNIAIAAINMRFNR